MPPRMINLVQAADKRIEKVFDPHIAGDVNDSQVKIAKFGEVFELERQVLGSLPAQRPAGLEHVDLGAVLERARVYRPAVSMRRHGGEHVPLLVKPEQPESRAGDQHEPLRKHANGHQVPHQHQHQERDAGEWEQQRP